MWGMQRTADGFFEQSGYYSGWAAALRMLCIATALTALILWCRELIASFHWRKGCCLKCGYDLTGNISGRCPECGTMIAMAIHRA